MQYKQEFLLFYYEMLGYRVLDKKKKEVFKYELYALGFDTFEKVCKKYTLINRTR